MPTPATPSLTSEVVPDVARLAQSLVNVYLVGPRGAADRGWALVDAGLRTTGPEIVRAAAERYGPESRPAAIVLTHGHFDHTGDVIALADQYDVPVYAHPMETPYLTGQASYPPPDPAVGGGAMSFLSRLYPRGPIDLGPRLRPLPADQTVPGMPGWRWVATPGHSPGHVSLFRESDRTLIAGDAFVTQRQESALAVLLRRQEVCRPPAYYTPDWVAARRSVATLAGLRPRVAAAGHGVPMSGEALKQGLATLVVEWDRVGVPAHGRYVGNPALTDERGVISVPPAVFDRQLVPALALVLAATVGTMLIAKPRTPTARGA